MEAHLQEFRCAQCWHQALELFWRHGWQRSRWLGNITAPLACILGRRAGGRNVSMQEIWIAIPVVCTCASFQSCYSEQAALHCFLADVDGFSSNRIISCKILFPITTVGKFRASQSHELRAAWDLLAETSSDLVRWPTGLPPLVLDVLNDLMAMFRAFIAPLIVLLCTESVLSQRPVWT